MTIQLTKTKAEAALGEQFEATFGALPGSARIAQLRKTAMGTFATLGLPHRRIEEWKYTDLRAAVKQAFKPAAANDDNSKIAPADLDAALGALSALECYRAVFINGRFAAELSSLPASDALTIKPLSAALDDLPRLNSSDSDSVIALNTAFMSDGAVITIADKAQVDKPVLMVFARAGADDKAIATRNVINVGKGAKALLVEVNIALAGAGNGQSNCLSEITIGDDAEVSHVKATREGEGSTHLSTWIGELGARVNYRAFQMTSETALVRNNLFVTFNGEDSKLDISGAFLGRGTEHIDTTLVVDHAVPGCESRELFKGVLDNTARGIFQGKVIVRQDAQKSDGKQMAQALMLSDTCEFDSKPELEIYADDVVCGHGSTSAQLDEEMMFYFRARGIPEDIARAMMIESFIGEALDMVEHERVREALADAARGWLK